jgi:hypothetical protein
MDTSKNVSQLHGGDVEEAVVLRRQLRGRDMIKFFEALSPTLVVTACLSCCSLMTGAAGLMRRPKMRGRYACPISGR